jgi:hypothetical protein
MTTKKKAKGLDFPVERLFPFACRARILIAGRDRLLRSKSRIHFILITRDLSATSRSAVIEDFSYYPIVEHYEMADLETHFGIQGAKVLGFAKSGLAQSIYSGLKQFRVNRPKGSDSAASNPPAAEQGTADS